MTIKELYSWARENNVEDYQLHIYCKEDNVETNENGRPTVDSEEKEDSTIAKDASK